MTVIAWDGKIIAADRQSTYGGLKKCATKLFKHEDSILGIAGTDCSGLMLIEWFKQGAYPEEWPKCQEHDDHWANLIVAKKESIGFYSLYPALILIEDSATAWGAGQDFAMGAMKMRANAIEAVTVTCELSDSCGCGIDAYDLSNMEKIR